MKKILSIVFAALLAFGAFAGCAKQGPSTEQNRGAAQSGEPAVRQTAVTTGGAVPLGASAAYAKLIAYKTEDYARQSIADFHAALASTPDQLLEFLAAEADVIREISPDDENYDFFATTLSLTSSELYCEYMGEEFSFSAAITKKSLPCSYLDDEGNVVYDFYCSAELQVPYVIYSPELVTVAERDLVLRTFKEEMQNYLNGLSEDEIADGNIRSMLEDQSAELASSLSTENMQLLGCEIYMLEISDLR